jgi:hypothetical protein
MFLERGVVYCIFKGVQNLQCARLAAVPVDGLVRTAGASFLLRGSCVCMVPSNDRRLYLFDNLIRKGKGKNTQLFFFDAFPNAGAEGKCLHIVLYYYR